MPAVTGPDGRTIEYAVAGAAGSGDPCLVFHHGQPGAALIHEDLVRAAARHRLGVVMLSRPGYGGSSRQPGRRIASAASDTRVVLDHLGAGWFVAAGWSGGGPHALACGALLAPRCRGVASIAGVAPYVEGGDLDWTAGMGPENVAEFTGMISGDPAVEGQVVELCAELAAIRADQLADALGGLISAPDRSALQSGAALYMAEWMRRSASSGHYGYWDDGQAFIAPWGFRLPDVAVPVQVWVAGQDLMVPPAHGEWLAAHIPEADKIQLQDEGHISLLTGHIGDIVDRLARAAGPV